MNEYMTNSNEQDTFNSNLENVHSSKSSYKLYVFIIILSYILTWILIIYLILYHFYTDKYIYTTLGLNTEKQWVKLQDYLDLQKDSYKNKDIIINENEDILLTINLLDMFNVNLVNKEYDNINDCDMITYYKTIGKVSPTVHLVQKDKKDLISIEDQIIKINEERKEPINAIIVKDKDWFTIQNAIDSDRIKYDILLSYITKYIQKETFTIDISKHNDIYLKAEIQAEDLQSKLDNLNKYRDLHISYTNGLEITKDMFYKYMEYDNDTDKISIKFKFLQDFIDDVTQSYNTLGKKKSFKTTNNGIVTLTTGIYGNIVDSENEKKELKKLINNGESCTDREPIYTYKEKYGDGIDIGNSYVEVSLDAQHLWCYVNGTIVMESDVVTGLNSSSERRTLKGVDRVFGKRANTYLKGATWNTHVDWFMPFNYNGQGFHDANWRGTFGGSIYTYNGSHGCVNMPPSKAKELYSIVEDDFPVVIY